MQRDDRLPLAQRLRPVQSPREPNGHRADVTGPRDAWIHRCQRLDRSGRERRAERVIEVNPQSGRLIARVGNETRLDSLGDQRFHRVSWQRMFWSFDIGGNRATGEPSDLAKRGLDVFLVE